MLNSFKEIRYLCTHVYRQRSFLKRNTSYVQHVYLHWFCIVSFIYDTVQSNYEWRIALIKKATFMYLCSVYFLAYLLHVYLSLLQRQPVIVLQQFCGKMTPSAFKVFWCRSRLTFGYVIGVPICQISDRYQCQMLTLNFFAAHYYIRSCRFFTVINFE